jgi:hypothetical protein
MPERSILEAGLGQSTAIALIMVGVLALAALFGALGGVLYLDQETSVQRHTTAPARALAAPESSYSQSSYSQ